MSAHLPGLRWFDYAAALIERVSALGDRVATAFANVTNDDPEEI